jgi:hypothetical protein
LDSDITNFTHQPHQYSTLILQTLPIGEVIQHIIQWNTQVKTSRVATNVPMFLLTVKTPNETPTTSDVLAVIIPKDQRYIWNIHWHKLTYNQKSHLCSLKYLFLECRCDKVKEFKLSRNVKFCYFCGCMSNIG